MKLALVIVGLNVQKNVQSQMVTGQMSLTGMEEIDCDEQLLPCGVATCDWECTLNKRVGSNQKVCSAKCTNSETGLQSDHAAKCSCVEMFGPIQIAAPCKWKFEFAQGKSPVCEDPETNRESTNVEQELSTIASVAYTESTKTLRSTQSSSGSPKISRTFHRSKNYHQNQPGNDKQLVCSSLPRSNEWKCENEILVHGTLCKIRCDQHNFRNKCVCNGDNCSWRKPIPSCVQNSNEQSSSLMMNDFSSHISPKEIFEKIELEEEMLNEEEEELNERAKSGDSDSLTSVLDFMKHMIEVNQNLYTNILDFLQAYIS